MSDEEEAQLLINIATINHQFTNEDFLKRLNGNVLSYTATKLAAMKASLVDMKVAAHRDSLDLEVEMDRQKALAYGRAMATSNATAAKELKYTDEEYIAARAKYNEAKVRFERLKSIVADAHDLIETIRSRTIDLQGARKDEGHR